MFFPSGVAAAAGAVQVKVFDFNLSDNFSPGAALVGVRFLTTGEMQTRESTVESYATIGNWLLYGNSEDFEVKYDFAGDACEPDFGVTGVFHSLDVNVLAELIESSGGVKSNSGTITIRQKTHIFNTDAGSGFMQVDNT